MRILLDKSEKSIEGAELLNTDENYSSSIHCSYYSCIQLMIHISLNVIKIDENSFDENINKKGSHNYIIALIRDKSIKESINIVNFNSGIKTLKDLRKKADYKQETINAVESLKAFILANKINQELKRFI